MQAWETLYTAPGLFFGGIGKVRVVFMGPLISNANFAKFIELLGTDIDNRPDTQARGVFYHIPDFNSDPDRRQAIALTLKEREEKLRKITTAYVMVTSSFVVRGVLKAIWWIAPPAYPSSVVSTPQEGFAYLATHMPTEDPEALFRTYGAIHEMNGWLTNSMVAAPGA